MSISVNSMVRNEPFAFYGIASVAPYVDEILVYDTGSYSEFLAPLIIASQVFPNVKLTVCPVSADGHGWKLDYDTVKNNNEQVGKELGDIRREMHDKSVSDNVMILDGDEVYSDDFIRKVAHFTNNEFHNFPQVCIQLYALDFVDKQNVRQKHEMGRIFKREKVFIKGDYPHEMHHSTETNQCLMPDNSIVLRQPHWEQKGDYFYHYECMVKPWRKEINKKMLLTPLREQQPEVFDRYKDGPFRICHNLIKKYGF